MYEGSTVRHIPDREGSFFTTGSLKADDEKVILPLSALSWNLSLAEDLKSLRLQDGPKSGMIIQLEPPTQPPILINGIYLQTLIRSYSTFELKLRGPNQSAQRFQMKMPSIFFQIEDYLKL